MSKAPKGLLRISVPVSFFPEETAGRRTQRSVNFNYLRHTLAFICSFVLLSVSRGEGGVHARRTAFQCSGGKSICTSDNTYCGGDLCCPSIRTCVCCMVCKSRHSSCALRGCKSPALVFDGLQASLTLRVAAKRCDPFSLLKLVKNGSIQRHV